MYNYLAERYDALTENVDYKVRSEYISGFFDKYGIKKGALILDLACGTGTITKLMYEKGYKMIGIDASEEMLSLADSKLQGSADFIKGRMQDFCLYEAADACICCLDSINHLSSIEEVGDAFECVYNSLKDGAIFIFDVNTIYKHNCILADSSFIFDEEDYFLAWDNELLDDNRIRIMLDFFVYNGKSYDRYSEEFIEKAYSVNELKDTLSPYFEVLGVYDDVSLEPPENSSERLYFICKRK